MKKINTLYLLDDPTKDKHVHRYLLDALPSAGFNPLICYFYGDAKDSKMASDDLEAISLGLSRQQFKGFRPVTVKKLRRLISERDILLVHCQRHRAMVHAGFALPGSGANVLFYTVRATNVLRNWNRRLVFNFLTKRISQVICVSSGVKEYMLANARALGEDKVSIVHNGVDIRQFEIDLPKAKARRWLGIPEDGFYFGIVARLKKAKCHDILLNAFKDVLKAYPDTRLAIVGDGPLEYELKQLACQLGIDERCHFTGRIQYHQVAKAMKAFDCFVHPSFREGLAVAILEAMASSLPVISTNAPGIKDIFDTKDNIGHMVRAQDTVALAESMIQFRGLDEIALKEIGLKAKKHIEKNFSKEAMIKANIKLYKKFAI